MIIASESHDRVARGGGKPKGSSTHAATSQCPATTKSRQHRHECWMDCYTPRTTLFFSDENKNAEDNAYFETTQEGDDLTFLRRELVHLQDLEQLLAELEEDDESQDA
jgi:hypothetical protein